MTTAQSFAPVVSADARVLILGSMPGRASLEAQQYYAHPRNSFWPILASLFQFDVTLAYTKRCAALKNNGVAVWDVLASCERAGSLDASIVEQSIVVNDFNRLYRRCPAMRHVFFNGGKACQAYRRYVLPTLSAGAMKLQQTQLPSTSPAHAALSVKQKTAQWRAVLMASVVTS